MARSCHGAAVGMAQDTGALTMGHRCIICSRLRPGDTCHRNGLTRIYALGPAASLVGAGNVFVRCNS